MSNQDFILLCVIGSLNFDSAKVERVFRFFDELGLKTDVVGEPGRVSIAGDLPGGDSAPLSVWSESLRREGIIGIEVGFGRSNGELPEHIANAFVGGGPITFLKVRTRQRTTSYVQDIVQSPSFELTSEKFAELIDAQPARDQIWGRLGERVREHFEMNRLPILEGHPRELIRGCDPVSWDVMALNWFSDVQVEAFVHGAEFVIPEEFETAVQRRPSLADLFGGEEDDETRARELFPSDSLEDRRARARMTSSGARWMLASTRKPWRVHQFRIASLNREPLSSHALSEAAADLKQALTEASDFAARVGSDFAIAFQLASTVFDPAWIDGDFQDAHLSRLLEAFEGRISRGVRQALQERSSIAREFVALDVPADAIRVMCACSWANVFGGMGSWNDLFFETEADQAEYHRISVSLFGALTAAKAAALQRFADAVKAPPV